MIIMKILERLRGSFYRRILKATGLCTACFIFEACYGTPEGDYDPIMNESIEFSGWVKEDSTKSGIENISVRIENMASGQNLKTFTDRFGRYELTMQAFRNDEIEIVFTDVDSSSNGLFESKDTIVLLSDDDYTEKVKQVDVLLKPL